ncbi:MAG: hypothetical protein HYY59_02590 [Candidatus Omnitrophica bacterium]|nr:hypothetical protein [Candidatus Omnitrophota bacterium]
MNIVKKTGGPLGIGLYALLFFSLAKVALPAPSPSSSSSVPSLRAADVFIPPEIGSIAQVYEAPTADPSAKLLIVIQDTHVNYEAQKHLADILDWLVSRYGIRLILVEGGEGDVSLSHLRSRGSRAVRQQVAEERLRSGFLSGEEYLDIVSDDPLILWGVDDPTLYDAHLKVFLDVERVPEAVGRDLGQLRQMLERVRAQAPNEALRRFETIQARFDAGKLGFGEYLDSLLGESKRLGVAIATYPNLQRLVTASEWEAQMDVKQVEEEQRQIMERLRPQATEQEWATLRATADKLRAGEIGSVTFYTQLEALAQQAHLALADFPHLVHYIRYLRLKADLEPRPLWFELGEVQRQLKWRLASSASEAALTSLADRVAFCERLAALEWTPADYQAYREQPDQIRVTQWLPALRGHAARVGVAFDWAGDGTALEAHLARAVRFYTIAHARDAELARRALSKMEADGERMAALIAGGFHTGDLIERLTKQQAQLVVVTPLTGQGGPDEADKTRYATILKAKYAQWRVSARRGQAD